MQSGIYVCTDHSTGNTGSTCITSTDTGERYCLSEPGSSSGQSLGHGLGTVADFPSDSPSSGWLSKLTHWFAYAIYSVVRFIISFFHDLVIFIFYCVFAVVLAAINAVGVPDFLSQGSLGSILGQAGPIVGFFVVQLHIAQALSLIAAGYVFRLTRKFLTLFQW